MRTILRLLGFLREPWRLVALAVSLGWATTVSWIALISTSAYLISYAALHPSVAELQVAIVGVRFFGISRAVFRYLERVVSHTVTFRVLAEMRVWLYEKIEPLVPAGLEDQRSSELYSKIAGDIETLQDFYVRVVAPPLVAILSSMAVLWFLGSLSAQMALVLLVFQVITGVAAPLAARKLGAASSRVIGKGRETLANLIVDGVQGSAEIQVYGLQGRYLSKFLEIRQRIKRAERAQNRIQSAMAALVVLGINLATFFLLMIAIPMVNQGGLDGKLLAVIVLGTLASFEAITPLPNAFQNLTESIQVGEGLFELADRSIPVIETGIRTVSSGEVDLRIKNLTFTYRPNTLPVISGFNLDLPQGKKVAILGPSGAGKSTIINLLLRLWPFDQGEIRLSGVDIQEYSLENLRRVFGYVPQNPFIFNTSLSENVRVGRPHATEEEIFLALEKAGLGLFVEGLPDGLETMTGEFGVMLSGGQRQRLALARALVRDAPIYLLDEPTENLDAVNAELVLNTFLDQLSDKSVLMISHRFLWLEKLDEILVMQDHRVVEQGHHDDLMRLNGVYARMFEQSKNVI
ncbi:MAG: thiol reductant ABC exporter subunit CydC [Anaerolineales bacterium]|nr:thiol reductant ABC exporter subunit CydC [Anaerolineales bacterium]